MMVEPPVQAWRSDHVARLRCEVCGRQGTVQDGDFDVLNAFLQRHKRCVPADVLP